MLPDVSAPIDLVDDCARCVGLCCVVLGFPRSAEFALDKPAGDPCRHLDRDFRCRVHARLPELGFAGCVTYSCFGAGPLLSRAFAGGDWRQDPETARHVFAAYPIARQLHELLWHVRAALAAAVGPGLADRLNDAAGEVEDLLIGPPTGIDRPTGELLRERIAQLLRRASAELRGPVPGSDLAGADLVGKDLRRTDLARASLRGALMLGADLRGAVLERTDLTGADLRRARLDGADLSQSLFVTETQLRAARGSATTVLPPGAARPATWLA